MSYPITCQRMPTLNSLPDILKPRHLRQLFNISQTALNRAIEEKRIPKPMYLGPRSRRWSKSELAAFIDNGGQLND